MFFQSHCAPILGAILLLLAIASPPAFAVTVDTVVVGNPGNVADPRDGDDFTAGDQHFGAVDYKYRIGTFEVTNAQYVQFLNAKAKTDSLTLYSTLANSDVRAGITREGVRGGYSYSLKPNMANKPVNLVNYYDAVRFANWMNNGQGDADTETGAYTLLGGTRIPENADSIARNPGSTWVLPTEDEWYKAAFHQPASLGGDRDDYWLYPTATNTSPAFATANSVGDVSNPGPNIVNYKSGAQWNGPLANVTTVGTAGPLSASYYGTFDQGGNVEEWTEGQRGPYRVARGGFFSADADTSLRSDAPAKNFSTDQNGIIGFRLVMIPEPSTLALAGIGALSFLTRVLRRRRASH
jgi:formylglycine-generating enzyme required for sulfatase activity